MNDLLDSERSKLYNYIRIAYMTENERIKFVDECRTRLLDMDRIDEIYSIEGITHLLAEAALDEIKI